MPAKLWNDGDALPDGLDVLAAFLSRVRDRVSHTGAPRARADGSEADASQRPHVQVGPLDTDPDRHDSYPVLHHTEHTAVFVGCSGECGRVCRFPSVWGAVEWTCGDCLGSISVAPVLTLHRGGSS